MSLLFAAVLGAIAQILIQAGIYWFAGVYQSGRGEFSGRWYSVCPAVGHEPERRDRLSIKQRGSRLFVMARRYHPETERGNVWKMRGYLHGNILVAIFYTTTPGRNPSSYGTLLLHRDSTVRGAIVWRGTYRRPTDTDLSSIVAGKVAEWPIVWQHVAPEKTNFAEPAVRP